MRIKKSFILIVLLFIGASLSMTVCRADNEIAASQAYVDKNHMDIFIPVNMDPDTLNLRISNQDAVLIDSGLIKDKNISVYTTVLLDISTSTPVETRDKTIEFINYLIRNIAPNEKYRIAAFGAELSVLQDFTSDRYDLSDSVSKVEFTAKQSMIYDAIYNTIPKLQPIDDEICYYRTIVITDGADVTSSGMTKEELYLKLKEDTYPVDVVDICKPGQTESKKELAALTRISGGKYNKIYPDTDNSELAAELDTGNIFWCRAEIPSSLSDGSTRQVNVSDERNDIQFDIKVSVYDAPATEISETVQEDDNAPAAPEESVAEPEKTDLSAVALAVFIVLAAAGIVIFILLIINNKKKPQEIKGPATPTPVPVPEPAPVVQDIRNEKTELVECSYTKFIIKISNVKKAGDNWTLPLDSELVIGRSEYSAIRLTDKSVSREQCKIVVHGENLAVVNLSNTNKTVLNGVNIPESSVLQAGDILKLGRETLHIDYIQSSGETQGYEEQNDVSFGSNTESIF